jgi:hypothetical protein
MRFDTKREFGVAATMLPGMLRPAGALLQENVELPHRRRARAVGEERANTLAAKG